MAVVMMADLRVFEGNMPENVDQGSTLASMKSVLTTAGLIEEVLDQMGKLKSWHFFTKQDVYEAVLAGLQRMAATRNTSIFEERALDEDETVDGFFQHMARAVSEVYEEEMPQWTNARGREATQEITQKVQDAKRDLLERARSYGFGG